MNIGKFSGEKKTPIASQAQSRHRPGTYGRDIHSTLGFQLRATPAAVESRLTQRTRPTEWSDVQMYLPLADVAVHLMKVSERRTSVMATESGNTSPIDLADSRCRIPLLGIPHASAANMATNTQTGLFITPPCAGLLEGGWQTGEFTSKLAALRDTGGLTRMFCLHFG